MQSLDILHNFHLVVLDKKILIWVFKIYIYIKSNYFILIYHFY